MIIEINEKAMWVEKVMINIDENLALNLADFNVRLIILKLLKEPPTLKLKLLMSGQSTLSPPEESLDIIINQARALERGAKAELRNQKRHYNMLRRALLRTLREVGCEKQQVSTFIGREISGYRKTRHRCEQLKEETKEESLQKPVGENA